MGTRPPPLLIAEEFDFARGGADGVVEDDALAVQLAGQAQGLPVGTGGMRSRNQRLIEGQGPARA